MEQLGSSWFSLPESSTFPPRALWHQATSLYSGEMGEKERQNGLRAVKRGVLKREAVRKGLMLATHLPPGGRVISWPGLLLMAIFGSVGAGV